MSQNWNFNYTGVLSRSNHPLSDCSEVVLLYELSTVCMFQSNCLRSGTSKLAPIQWRFHMLLCRRIKARWQTIKKMLSRLQLCEWNLFDCWKTSETFQARCSYAIMFLERALKVKSQMGRKKYIYSILWAKHQIFICQGRDVFFLIIRAQRLHW